MDRVLSARLSEDAVATLEAASRRLGMTKKRFLEEAIRLRADQPDQKEREREQRTNELIAAIKDSFGAWADHPADETPETIRRGFERELDERQRRFRADAK